MAQVVVALMAHTRLARIWLGLVNIALRLGWKPSLETANRMAAIAGKLIWTRTVKETGSKNGWRTYSPGQVTVSLPPR
jgi:uncharacterized membrane protein YozB (DUF420 family)